MKSHLVAEIAGHVGWARLWDEHLSLSVEHSVGLQK